MGVYRPDRPCLERDAHDHEIGAMAKDLPCDTAAQVLLRDARAGKECRALFN
jgi:hypothetical protein